MTQHRDALAFLIRRTAANRFKRQVARLRTPRYLPAFIAGVLYVWFVFFGPSELSHVRASGSSGFVAIAAAGFAITVITWWLGKSAYLALAFRPAEVQFLFPAPLSRRTLLTYKLVRSQLLIVINAVVWTLFIKRTGVALSSPLRLATAWGFFTVLSLHRLGVALVQTRPAPAVRRAMRYVGSGLAAAAVVALVIGVGPAILRLGRVGMLETMRAVGRSLSVPPASYAMAPFRLMVAPLYAPTTDAWIRAFGVVLVIAALHVVWVLAMNVKFEEEAAVASEALARRRAAFRERRAGHAVPARKGRVQRNYLPLSPRGRPAVAIAWKNTIALARTGSLRSLVLVVVVVAIASRAILAAAAPRPGVVLALPYLMVAGMMLVAGPRIVRNDLRQDLLSVSLLKSYPLRGVEIVAVELVSPTLVLVAFQMAMLLLAYLSLAPDRRLVLGGVATATIAMLTPFALAVINGLGVAIQNAAALLFPAWVRLGPDSGGVETIGQNLLLMVGSMLALVVALIVPVVVGTAIALALAPMLGGAATTAAGVAAVAVLAGELALLVVLLGRVFERTDAAIVA